MAGMPGGLMYGQDANGGCDLACGGGCACEAPAAACPASAAGLAVATWAGAHVWRLWLHPRQHCPGEHMSLQAQRRVPRPAVPWRL